MPNKLFNNVHKGDTTKGQEGGKKAEEKTTRNTYGDNPQFAGGLDSDGNQNPSFGQGQPGKVKS